MRSPYQECQPQRGQCPKWWYCDTNTHRCKQCRVCPKYGGVRHPECGRRDMISCVEGRALRCPLLDNIVRCEPPVSHPLLGANCSTTTCDQDRAVQCVYTTTDRGTIQPYWAGNSSCLEFATSPIPSTSTTSTKNTPAATKSTTESTQDHTAVIIGSVAVVGVLLLSLIILFVTWSYISRCVHKLLGRESPPQTRTTDPPNGPVVEIQEVEILSAPCARYTDPYFGYYEDNNPVPPGTVSISSSEDEGESRCTSPSPSTGIPAPLERSETEDQGSTSRIPIQHTDDNTTDIGSSLSLSSPYHRSLSSGYCGTYSTGPQPCEHDDDELGASPSDQFLVHHPYTYCIPGGTRQGHSAPTYPKCVGAGPREVSDHEEFEPLSLNEHIDMIEGCR